MRMLFDISRKSLCWVLALLLSAASLLAGCGGSGGSSGNADQTSGDPYHLPNEILQSPYQASGAVTGNGASIDVSSVSQGYVAAACTNPNRLKFQVLCDDMSYNYDLPSDGTPISCPINMGDGSYTFRVMQNTSGNNYVELLSTSEAVTLATEFEPFLRPSTYCMYTPTSAVVAQAKALAADAANEGDVMRNVYYWVTSNIQYDADKAAQLSNATGYVPDPDQTLAEHTGICFDYASLTAALLRSLGIPCKIVTGYVEPDDIYHAWNMVHLNGTWVGTDIDIQSGTWSRIDLTFAAAGDGANTVGDGKAYVDRYTY